MKYNISNWELSDIWENMEYSIAECYLRDYIIALFNAENDKT